MSRELLSYEWWARSAEVSAIISYRRAKTNFYRSIGQLLDHLNVTLSDDE